MKCDWKQLKSLKKLQNLHKSKAEPIIVQSVQPFSFKKSIIQFSGGKRVENTLFRIPKFPENAYFMRVNKHTVSIFAVHGNWSTAAAFTTSYPPARRVFRSFNRLDSLQEMYTMYSTP